MFLNKLKQMAAVVVLVSVFSAGVGVSIRQAFAEKPLAPDKEPAAKGANQPKDDRKDIRGTWETWSEVTRTNGDKTTTEQQKTTWVITDDKMMTVGGDGFLEEERTFKLDPTKTPKAIDTTERRLGFTFLGIYQLEGDTLKISYGDKRPSEFSEHSQVFTRVSRSFAPVTPRFANAPGCFWMINPIPAPASMGTAAIQYFYDEERDGSVVITMSYLARIDQVRARRELRPVLIDAAGTRFLPKMMHGGSGSVRNGPEIVMYRWRMDPNLLPARNVAQIGIEAVTPEAHRHAAREALERAKIANTEVLPWPEVGEAYRFALTAIDGRRMRSEELKGKVVLIDYWSSTFSPCMAMMPELKTFYERWHRYGLEIIGVSLDQDVETVRKTCRTEGLTWPQVFVPDDEPIRNLWREAFGNLGIPRVLLIDREGILRDPPGKLEEKIGELLAGSADKTRLKPKP